jgi:hypothetical protein
VYAFLEVVRGTDEVVAVLIFSGGEVVRSFGA